MGDSSGANAVTHHLSVPEDQVIELMRSFETGATRNQDASRVDPEGFLSPLVIERFCEYMHINRVQKGGSLRDSDNWQKGIPKDVYMKSAWRHFLHLWLRPVSYTHLDVYKRQPILCLKRYLMA